LGLSSLVIGLTVVSFGTSSPELFVSVKAVLSGQPDMAFGNVIGSNIFNILLILGISAVICPLAVSGQLLRIDIPVMLSAVGAVFLLCLDGRLSLWDGLLLLSAGIVYTGWTLVAGKAASNSEKQEHLPRKTRGTFFADALMIITGLAGLMFGSRLLIASASDIARSLGISELVIALTLVSAGTSLPEAAASVMAALRGERDMAIGNVIGSNIYNLFFILGSSAAASGFGGLHVPLSILTFDLVILAVVSLACLPIFFSHAVIDRWEGVLFLIYYVIYTTYLVLKSTSHDSLPYLSSIVLYFVMPMSMVIILSILLSSCRQASLVKKRGGV